MSRIVNRKRNSTGACRRMIQSTLYFVIFIVTGCCEAKDQSELFWTLQDTNVNRFIIYLLVEWDSKFSANSDRRAQASILSVYSDIYTQYIYNWVKNIYTRLNLFRLTQMTQTCDNTRVWYSVSYTPQVRRATTLTESVIESNETALQNQLKRLTELLVNIRRLQISQESMYFLKLITG